MRKCYLLTFVLSIVLAGSVTAQKAEQLKNSYNFKRALEILQSDGEQTEAMDAGTYVGIADSSDSVAILNVTDVPTI